MQINQSSFPYLFTTWPTTRKHKAVILAQLIPTSTICQHLRSKEKKHRAKQRFILKNHQKKTSGHTGLSKLAQAFNKLPNNTKGALILLVAAAGFSGMALLIKLAGQRLPVVQIIFVRQLVMTLIMLPKISRSFPESITSKRPDLHLLRISVALVAMLAGFTAVINMPLADATAIGFAKSFFVTIFAIMILRETVGPRRWVATILGFIGVVIMLQPGGDSFTIYGIYAAVAAVAAGLVMVIIRLLSRTEAPATILIYQAVGVGSVLAIPAYLYWKAPTTEEWLLMLLIGVTGYWSQMANIYAYKFGEASLLAPLEYTRLIYATIFGIMVFGNYPAIETIIGAIIVVIASAYTIHREASLKRTAKR